MENSPGPTDQSASVSSSSPSAPAVVAKPQTHVPIWKRFTGKGKIVSLGVLLLIVTGIPATILLGQQQQDIRQHAAGTGAEQQITSGISAEASANNGPAPTGTLDVTAAKAIDGNTSTPWNSGAPAPQFIMLIFDRPHTITHMQLLAAQTPNGPTVHNIYMGSSRTALSLVGILSGTTSDGQWLTFTPPAPVQNVQFIKVETTQSPSWIAWWEIEAFEPAPPTATPTPVPTIQPTTPIATPTPTPNPNPLPTIQPTSPLSQTPTPLPTSTLGPTSCNMMGTYVIRFTTFSGAIYEHTLNITVFNPTTGIFSGTGHYNPDPSYTWNITGQQTGKINNRPAFTAHIIYTGTGAGYTTDMQGTILPSGALQANWLANGIVVGTVTSISGKSTCIQPTPRPSPTPTVIASGTPSPTLPSSSSAQLSFTVLLDGVGSAGDSTNPTNSTTSTKNPTQSTIQLAVEYFDPTNEITSVAQSLGAITYDATSGAYKGSVSSSLPTGNYIVKVKTQSHLRRRLPGAIHIASGQTTTLPQITLVTGDVNNDNVLDIQDWNQLLSGFLCAQGQTPDGVTCANVTTPANDLNLDGAVDLTDLNLFLREIQVQQGD